MNPDGVKGVRGPDYRVPIEHGAIRQFARSLYSSHPDWLQDPHAVVPPTFLLSAGYHWGYILERPPAGSALAAIDQTQGVGTDGEHAFEYFGEPPHAGSVLTASTQVADHFYKQGQSGGRLEFFVMQTDFHDALGRLVARWQPTSIRTEKAAAAAAATQRVAARAFLRKDADRSQLDRIAAASPRDLRIDGGPAAITMPALTLTEMIRYQCASGEDSPGHHDALAAQAHGLPDCFSVGMQHAGILATIGAHWLGPKNVRRFKARFLDTVWPGDVLTYQARITQLGDCDEGHTVDLALTCSRDGKPVVVATARFLAPAHRA